MVSVNEIVDLNGLQVCNYSSSMSVKLSPQNILMTFNIASGSFDFYDLRHDAQHGRRGVFVSNVSFRVEPIPFQIGAGDLEVGFMGIDATRVLKARSEQETMDELETTLSCNSIRISWITGVSARFQLGRQISFLPTRPGFPQGLL
jgi:hypothetical protein